MAAAKSIKKLSELRGFFSRFRQLTGEDSINILHGFCQKCILSTIDPMDKGKKEKKKGGMAPQRQSILLYLLRYSF